MGLAAALSLAVIAGALAAAQAPIYARLSLAFGTPVAAAAAGFTLGLIALLAVLAITGGHAVPRWEDVRAAPLWAWLGGLFGATIILLSVAAIPRLGVAPFLVSLIAGQLAAGLVYDRLGLFGLPMRPITPAALLGVALVLAGAVLVIRR